MTEGRKTSPPRGRVLVVDDDDNIRHMLEVYFRGEGFSVTTADSAKSAQSQIEKDVPDLILMDVMMPDINGIELCRWVRGRPASRNVPIIQMSALRDEITVQDSLEMGAMDYITKPVDFDDLQQKVTLALQRAQRRRQAT